MKKCRLITFFVGLFASISLLSGCAIADMFEKKITVEFAVDGEVVETGEVTQYKNIKSPDIASSYIPKDYRFLGWTGYEESQLDFQDAVHFKQQYIAAGRMVHYMEARQFSKGNKTTFNALIIHKDDIPKVYHYAVVAWYDKVANSGLNQSIMDTFEKNYRAYLLSEGVSQEDVNTVVVRGYAGNVGPTTGQILFDDDVDLMFGWGSLENITTTGQIPPEKVLQTESYSIAGHARTIHRLTNTEGCLKTMEYLMSESVRAYFAG